MTQPTPAAPKATKKKRVDVYQARATITIPLPATDPDAWRKAVEAVDGILAELPAGSTVEFQSRGASKV